MNRFRIETTVTQRRIYFIDAEDAESAAPKINEGPPDVTEDQHEEIESITSIA